ncbi:MAG: right-handed parallel beta-helix repeat-containing protein [Planctomycetota bacterium]|jgi:hypothetical protein
MRKLIFAITCLFWVVQCSAEIIVVEPDGSGDYPTIQAAVDAAYEGDEVVLSIGTYTGDGNRDIDPNGKAITVRSTNPNDPNIVASTVINCGGDRHRGFYFHSGEDANTILDGLTITNGDASTWGDDFVNTHGGAILCDASSPAITNCTFTDNWASKGGAMFSYNSEPVVVKCTFTDNDISAVVGLGTFGGAMYNNRSNSIITDCSFSGNSANYGGAMCNLRSNPVITNCTFSGNSTISGSVSLSCGGAIGDRNQSNSVVINCIFSGNSAAVGGGAMFMRDSHSTVTNCTFTNNSAGSWSSGAIGNFFDGSSVVTNCILWGNGPNQIDLGCFVTYSNVQGGWDGVGNIDIDPCFVDPCDGDFHLKSEGWSWDIKRNRWAYNDVTSRCIDAGNPGCPLGDEPMSVPDDPNNTWGENIRINMGAYGGTAEASIPPYDWTLLADLTNDGIVNLNRDGVINMPDLALLVEDWLKETVWH